MIRSSSIAFRALVGVAAVAAPAAADNSSIHLTANGSVAATDNVFASTGDTRQGDVFTQLRPGMLFAYDAPRMIHELTAEVEFLEYALHSDRPSVTFRAGWRGLFLPGPRSEVILAANGGTGQLNALTSRTSADSGGIVVAPAGVIDLRQADSNEYATYQASKGVRLSQTLLARYTATNDNAGTTVSAGEAAASLAIERTFRHDTFGFDVGASIVHLERLVNTTPPVTGPMGSRLDQQLNPRAGVQWRHDLDKQWSINGDAGVVLVNPYGFDPHNPMDTTRKRGTFPTFGALVAFTDRWGRATAAARRTVAPNLFIAQNTVNDSLIGQVAMPLPWLSDSPLRNPKLVGLGSIGVERTQLIDSTTSTLNGEFDIVRVDLAVAYNYAPGQTYGLRFESLYQHGNDAAGRIVPTPSYYRNTLFFTFTLRYPDRVAVSVPRRTQSVRSDRKDLAPIGAEPVIVDPTDAVPGGEEGER